jgi:hypothetical protein
MLSEALFLAASTHMPLSLPFVILASGDILNNGRSLCLRGRIGRHLGPNAMGIRAQASASLRTRTACSNSSSVICGNSGTRMH